MTTTATARFEARIPKHIHDTIKLASQMTGRSMTDFVMSLAYQEAQKTLKAHDETMQILKLSKQDQQDLLNNLINPPPMNDAMKRAVELYNTTVVEVN